MNARPAEPDVLQAWARYTQERGVEWKPYTEGIELLFEPGGYWLMRGFAAVLAHVEHKQ